MDKLPSEAQDDPLSGAQVTPCDEVEVDRSQLGCKVFNGGIAVGGASVVAD